MNYNRLYIDGQWVTPHSTKVIAVENPATKQVIATVPDGDRIDVNRAVAAAAKAFTTYSQLPETERIQVVEKVVELLITEKEGIAKVITEELGVIAQQGLTVHVEGYIANAQAFVDVAKTYDYLIPYEDYTVVKEPVGVVAALTPWNFPLGQVIQKVIPALLSGCTVVLKPSQKTPLTAYWLVDLFHRAGLPKGALNLVTGRGREVGNFLSTHLDVDMVSLTGSVEAGKEVARLAAEDLKRVTLELGGKSPTVLLRGGSVECAVDQTLAKAFINTGQICASYSRLIIPEEMKSEVEAMVVEKAKGYSFGDPLDPNAKMGPLASAQQFEKVRSYIALGIEEGATLLVGKVPDESDAYYVGPTVFTDVDNSMRIAQEEIFGPVVCIITYTDEAQALHIANDVTFGLAGAVFAADDDRAAAFARKIRAGSLLINGGAPAVGSPFGGYKHSGYGREAGVFGYDEFFEVKAIKGWRIKR